MEENLVKNVDMERIANEGKKIYEAIKSKYDPQNKGRFLAIEVDSKEVFLADSTVEAVEAAKSKYPDKVFYVVKIGFSANEILSRLARA